MLSIILAIVMILFSYLMYKDAHEYHMNQRQRMKDLYGFTDKQLDDIENRKI
jgi:hypothetical protein